MSVIPIDHWPSRLHMDPWFDEWWATRPQFPRPFDSTFEEIQREIERHRREIEREIERHHREFLSRANFPPLPPIPFDDQYAPRLNPDGRGVSIDITLPDHVDPSKVNVSCKDREIIIKAEDKQDRSDGYSSFSFYQRSTLPDNTDLNQLKATISNNRLSITAPVNNTENRASFRQIPIDSSGRGQINY